jgi:anti-sigma factor RsiW
MRDETMQCPTKTGEGIEVILAYLGGRLAPETAKALEAHLEECQGCQEVLLAQSAVFDALDDWSPEPVSAGFNRRLYERIEAEQTNNGWWRRRFGPLSPTAWKPALAVATACLLLVAVVLLSPTASAPPGEVATADPVDIEQLEQVVEDMDMLYMLESAAEFAEEPEQEDSATEEGVGVVTLSFGMKRCV